MSQPAETWYALAIADSPSLRMLLADIRDHVRRARLSRRLDGEARIYAVIESDSVRLWVNRPALEGLDVFRRLTLQPAEPPAAHERVNPLIEHESAEAPLTVAASRAAASASPPY
jgi:hypothetical protein